MHKVVFTGCSFTAGNGWVDHPNSEEGRRLECKDHPDLWVNLVANQLNQLKDLQIVNAGQGGASNFEIFANTVDAISKFQNEIKLIFCQWTAMPRYSFSVGFELWSTHEGLPPSFRSKFDVNLNKGESYKRKYLDDLLDKLLALHHLHPEIVKVVRYCNVLQNLARAFGIKIYFINGLCPWDQNYFTRLTEVLPESYTPFTKKEILNIDSRDDNDILKLYEIMHNDYEQAGGIDPTQWVNLYNSMMANRIDRNYDTHHPGIKSNQIYFQQIKNFLEKQ
jgi:hypothetical protein